MRFFYFVLGGAIGAFLLWAAVNVSDSTADAVKLVPKSDLTTAQLVIGDLENRLAAAAQEISRVLGLLEQLKNQLEGASTLLDSFGIGGLLDALERLAP